MLKEEVLSMLLNAQEPVSGEGICKTLGVTRAAVWKTIDQLRQEGYGIDAAPKRGYTLASVPDRLDTALVRAHLSGHPWQTLVTAAPSSTAKKMEHLPSMKMKSKKSMLA